jgi:hypothetical protein
MNNYSIVLFIAFLIVGVASILLIIGTYLSVLIRNKSTDSIFFAIEYASKREKLLFKIGGIGIVITITLFIIL